MLIKAVRNLHNDQTEIELTVSSNETCWFNCNHRKWDEMVVRRLVGLVEIRVIDHWILAIVGSITESLLVGHTHKTD